MGTSKSSVLQALARLKRDVAELHRDACRRLMQLIMAYCDETGGSFAATTYGTVFFAANGREDRSATATRFRESWHMLGRPRLPPEGTYVEGRWTTAATRRLAAEFKEQAALSNEIVSEVIAEERCKEAATTWMAAPNGPGWWEYEYKSPVTGQLVIEEPMLLKGNKDSKLYDVESGNCVESYEGRWRRCDPPKDEVVAPPWRSSKALVNEMLDEQAREDEQDGDHRWHRGQEE